MQLWAGVECTYNRVRDQYFEQLGRAGHLDRPYDLKLFADLGIKSLRYPVLWETTAPDDPRDADWSFADERLAEIRRLGINPIVGLVHHGSGPEHTNLLDPEFPEKLAKFAAAVAERYPWVTDYTPINEPLTTARFSGLYGHWYPHHANDASFVRALITECKATALAMRAIRAINPRARLIQTEDLGHTCSSPKLKYQANFENERRWLSFDLLCGRVNPKHPLYLYLTVIAKASREELDWFVQNPCPPDIIGINFYLSSQRFLDDKLYLYPRHMHGGNGRHRYVDTETARVRSEGMLSLKTMLLSVWQRYRIPIAITECHNGCTREEQLRWVKEVWSEAVATRQEGADIRAVTAWALLGSFDWNSLVTLQRQHYEPGVFDVRSDRPRPTALAGMFRDLGRGITPQHPLLEVPGWWHQPDRHTFGFAFVGPGKIVPAPKHRRPHRDVRPLLITGATGTLGRAFARICEERHIPYVLSSRQDIQISDPESVARAFERLRPWGVINTAGFVRMDDAEKDPATCMRDNAEGPAVLALHCAIHDIPFVTFSSDLVFDGEKRSPYVESDRTNPLNIYGRSKLIAEQQALQHWPRSLVIRTSAFFGPWDDYNFATLCLKALSRGEEFSAIEDYVVSPTYVPDLVHQTLDLMIDGESGIWHLANPGEVTWYEFAKMVAESAGIRTSRLRPITLQQCAFAAPRPNYSVLSSERGHIMPALGDAVRRYVAQVEFSAQKKASIAA
jgi:dTDP-4-dehydrorhamnose reductase